MSHGNASKQAVGMSCIGPLLSCRQLETHYLLIYEKFRRLQLSGVLRRLIFFMVALWNRETIYIFMLWFVLLSSSFFSSPNLSRHRLDVCHTSTHGVALVRI